MKGDTIMATFFLVTIPLTIGYCKIAEKVIVPVVEGIVEGVKDGIRDVKAMNAQDKETKK